MTKNKQIVILETDEGTCSTGKLLKFIWNKRLKDMNLNYYKIKSARILKKSDF